MQAGRTLGRFLLERELGEGSHGVVFRALDTALDAPVAVKILHPWLTRDTAVLERFKRELLLARRVSHPAVCRVFDLHQEGDVVFLTLELLEGTTLFQSVQDQGAFSPSRALPIFRSVVQGLAAAHDAGVIHRDLKPSNVLICKNDRAVILDFGTATARDVARLTRPGVALGSMRYIAPELFKGASPTTRADIYSFGVGAYYVLTGKLPYDAAANAVQMLERLRSPPPAVDKVAPHVSPALGAIIARAMAIDPGSRYATAHELDEALTACDFDVVEAAAGFEDRTVPLTPQLERTLGRVASTFPGSSLDGSVRSDEPADPWQGDTTKSQKDDIPSHSREMVADADVVGPLSEEAASTTSGEGAPEEADGKTVPLVQALRPTTSSRLSLSARAILAPIVVFGVAIVVWLLSR